MVADHSAIEWTNATWNPATGCDRVSPGCANCYALDLAARLKAMGSPRYQRDGDPKTSGPGFGVTLHPDKLEEPLRWRKPRMVFVNSMSDLFHEEVPFEFIERVFTTMLQAEQHIFQVLTKRPERMLEFFRHGADYQGVALADLEPWPNIWLGVSIENRRFVHRADLLRQVPAAVRFVSAEPLLGPLVPDGSDDPNDHPWQDTFWSDGYEGQGLDLTGIDWLICGGESGKGHRPVKPEWVRDLRDAALGDCLCCARCPVGECQQVEGGERIYEYRTAFFFKQWGGLRPTSGGRELDGRTWDEFPALSERAAA